MRARDFTNVFVAALLVVGALFLSMTMNSTTNVSAVDTNVGVYGDSNYDNPVDEIKWGTLEPGSVKDVSLYILNEGDEAMYLTMSTEDWTPSEAVEYMNLKWDYDGREIESMDGLQVTLSLFVSPEIEEIWNFRFNIRIAGDDHLICDLNGDGRVDTIDLIFYFAPSYRSRIGDESYNPDADFDGSGTVDSIDLILYFCPNFTR